MRIKHQYDLEKHKESFLQKMKGVPIENQIEPDEQLVWNAAQALKACISKEELREIFASLLERF